MRSTVIPAQITTVEDKITNNLSLTQLVILVFPILISFIFYLIIPPAIKLSIIKIGLSLTVFILLSPLAIRVNDKILLLWIMLFIKYYSRESYYVFNKNDLTYRLHTNEPIIENLKSDTIINNKTDKGQQKINGSRQQLSLENLINNPMINFSFKNSRKGSWHVNVSKK